MSAIRFRIDRLESPVNSLLRTNPEFSELTDRLAGRVLAVAITGVPCEIVAMAEPGHVTLLTETEIPPDVRIRGSVPALIAYLRVCE